MNRKSQCAPSEPDYHNCWQPRKRHLIQEIYTTNNPKHFDINFKLHARGRERWGCLGKWIVPHSVMDTKLHGFLADDLREMASCSEAWQLTLHAWTKHMRFLNITNTTLPSRSSLNQNIKASEKHISKPLYAQRVQGKGEIKIPASSYRWPAKALKLLTQANYNATRY